MRGGDERMYIGNIAFARATRIEEQTYKKLGRLWYDQEKHSCALSLAGIRQGQWFCKPYKNLDMPPPYLSGDICAATGEFDEGGVHKKEYLWCGWMWTDSDQRGCVYNGVIEVNPMPALMYVIMRQIKERSDLIEKRGIFLSVFLDDREKHETKTA